MSRTNVSCNGGTNGTANVSISGGTPPYSILWSNGATVANLTGLAAGTYTVVVTDSKGCTKGGSVTLTQPSPIVVNITTSGPAGGPYTDMANVSGGTPPYSYSWTPGGQTTPSAGGHVLNVQYTVKVTDGKGCIERKSITHTARLADPNASSQTGNSDFDAVVYPNPTHGAVSIEFDAVQDKLYKVQIVDYLGQVVSVKEGTTAEGRNYVDYDFSGMATGIYFVRLDVGDQNRVIRVVFE
jgi:hypothetical protein